MTTPIVMQLPNPLFWYDPTYGLKGFWANFGVVGQQSFCCNQWDDRSGNGRHLQAYSAASTQSNSVGMRSTQSAINNGVPILSYNDGYPGYGSFACKFMQSIATQGFSSRGLSVFFIVRQRKTSDIPSPSASPPYLFELTGSAVFSRWYNAYQGSVGTDGFNGPKHSLLQEAGNGPFSEAMIVAYSFDVLGFVTDASGNTTFYENGYASKVFSVTAPSKTFTTFAIPEAITSPTTGPIEYGHIAGFATALTSQQVRDLTTEWFDSYLKRPIPTVSLGMYGDSIWAGSGVVTTSTGKADNKTTAMWVYTLDPRLRITDMTQSGTQQKHSYIWSQWNNNTTQTVPDAGSISNASPKGGNLIHGHAGTGVGFGPRYPSRITMIEQCTNDLCAGDATSNAIALANLQQAVGSFLIDNNPQVYITTCISRVWAVSDDNFANQAAQDAGFSSYNTTNVVGLYNTAQPTGVGAVGYMDRAATFTNWATQPPYQADGVHLSGGRWPTPSFGMEIDAGLVNTAIQTILGTSPVTPVNMVLPVISGSPGEGQILATTNAGWNTPLTGVAYQWKSSGANVGTNIKTYTIQNSDVGNTITCTVTATNAFGSTAATSAATSTILALPALRSSSSATTAGASVTSLDIAYPTGAGNVPVAGDYIAITLLAYGATALGGVSTPSGYTLLGTKTVSTNVDAYVFYMLAAGGESGNVTPTFSASTDVIATMRVVKNVFTGVSGLASAGATSGSTVTVASITPTTPSFAIFDAGFMDGTAGSSVPSSISVPGTLTTTGSLATSNLKGAGLIGGTAQYSAATGTKAFVQTGLATPYNVGVGYIVS